MHLSGTYSAFSPFLSKSSCVLAARIAIIQGGCYSVPTHSFPLKVMSQVQGRLHKYFLFTSQHVLTLLPQPDSRFLLRKANFQPTGVKWTKSWKSCEKSFPPRATVITSLIMNCSSVLQETEVIASAGSNHFCATATIISPLQDDWDLAMETRKVEGVWRYGLISKNRKDITSLLLWRVLSK